MEEAGAPVYNHYMPDRALYERTLAAAHSQLDENAAGLAPDAFGRLVAWIATVSTCI
jgi:predicted transcriptional regulator